MPEYNFVKVVGMNEDGAITVVVHFSNCVGVDGGELIEKVKTIFKDAYKWEVSFLEEVPSKIITWNWLKV